MTLFSVSRAPLFTFSAEEFGWAEGIAYSRDGSLLAVAEHTRDKIALLSNNRIVGHVFGPSISAPHDVAFSKYDRELAIANRGNATVTLHERTGPGVYSNEPRMVLHKKEWVGTTAVSFDETGERVVVVNHIGAVTCFVLDGSIAWTLGGEACGFSTPDGIAFSRDGELLAVANNTSHEVTLHARSAREPGYQRSPIARLRGLRHPHSLAFTDDGATLIVTNSGGPDIAVFCYKDGEWGRHPAMQWPACAYMTFLSAHYEAFIASGKTLACEGGAKGLALHSKHLAWSGPNIGVRVHEISA